MHQDDDPVVDEFPVFLCRELEDKLFVLQYPVHPAITPGTFDIVKSQIKPENQEVILEVGLDTNSPNYDKSHGEQIALSIEKETNSSQKAFPLKYVDRIRLESKRGNLDSGCYAVGTVVHGSLILSPVRGAVSLSPNLSHLVNPSSEDPPAASGEEEAKMVRVQFSKVETEKSKKLREQSYSYYCQKFAEEPWYFTDYYGPTSPLAQVERQKLANSLREGSILLSSANYLDSLAEKASEGIQNREKDALTHRVTELLTRVRTIKTSLAAETLGVSESEVLPCLQTSGVLVQGVWVLRSDIKFVGGLQAVPQEQLMRARDYVLYQFWEGKCIERAKLNELVRLPPEVLYDIISEIGKLSSNNSWIFRHPPDRNFISRYPEVVEQESLRWEARAQQVQEGLGSRRRRRDSNRRRGNSLSEEDTDTTKRGRKKSECDVKPDVATLAGIKS